MLTHISKHPDLLGSKSDFLVGPLWLGFLKVATMLATLVTRLVVTWYPSQRPARNVGSVQPFAKPHHLPRGGGSAKARQGKAMEIFSATSVRNHSPAEPPGNFALGERTWKGNRRN